MSKFKVFAVIEVDAINEYEAGEMAYMLIVDPDYEDDYKPSAVTNIKRLETVEVAREDG